MPAGFYHSKNWLIPATDINLSTLLIFLQISSQCRLTLLCPHYHAGPWIRLLSSFTLLPNYLHEWTCEFGDKDTGRVWPCILVHYYIRNLFENRAIGSYHTHSWSFCLISRHRAKTVWAMADDPAGLEAGVITESQQALDEFWPKITEQIRNMSVVSRGSVAVTCILP